MVTVLDTATGKTENVVLPRYQEADSKALWKPLFDQLRSGWPSAAWRRR